MDGVDDVDDAYGADDGHAGEDILHTDCTWALVASSAWETEMALAFAEASFEVRTVAVAGGEELEAGRVCDARIYFDALTSCLGLVARMRIVVGGGGLLFLTT